MYKRQTITAANTSNTTKLSSSSAAPHLPEGQEKESGTGDAFFPPLAPAPAPQTAPQANPSETAVLRKRRPVGAAKGNNDKNNKGRLMRSASASVGNGGASSEERERRDDVAPLGGLRVLLVGMYCT